MKYLNLYRLYLYNAIKRVKEKDRELWLENEKRIITEIRAGIDNCFLGDKSLVSKENTNDIYRLIKYEILYALNYSSKLCDAIFIHKFLLQGIINEISNLQCAA